MNSSGNIRINTQRAYRYARRGIKRLPKETQSYYIDYLKTNYYQQKLALEAHGQKHVADLCVRSIESTDWILQKVWLVEVFIDLMIWL